MFPTTRWSCVLALQDADESVRWRALHELMEAYRPALYYFLRGVDGMPAEQAEDVVQSFLMDRVLKGRILEQAKATQGHLRSFLLKSFQNFVISERRKMLAQKRMPSGGYPIALEDAPESAQAIPAEASRLDAAWARQTLALALDRFREECKSQGRGDWWDVFEARILAPCLGEGNAWTFDELARKHGFAKPQDAANALVSAKRCFGRVLRLVVADTLPDARHVDEEIRNLCAALAREPRGMP